MYSAGGILPGSLLAPGYFWHQSLPYQVSQNLALAHSCVSPCPVPKTNFCSSWG